MDKIIQKKVWYKQQQNRLIILFVLIILGLYFQFLNINEKVLKIKFERLDICISKKDVFKDYISTLGTVFPIRTIYIDAMEGGRIEEIFLEEGSMVKKNDVILILSNPNLNLSIMNSEAELAEKTNHLRNTRVVMEQDKLNLKSAILEIKYKLKQLKRAFFKNKVFFEENFISEEEFLISKENYEYALEKRKLLKEREKQDSLFRMVQVSQLEFSLKRMRENLNLVRKKLDNLEVKAMVDGQIGLLNAEIGEAKSKGQRLGLIHVLTKHKIQAKIDEHYISRVKKGLKAQFEFNNKNYNLLVKKIYPEVRDGQFEIDMEFTDDIPKDIRTGQNFRTKLELGESKKAIIIKKGSFFQSTGGNWVYVIDVKTKTARKKQIKLGRQNPNYYEVIEGLSAGEQIIISSYNHFNEADKLIIK